ncbi:MAG: trypsin-like peptidase domain-containing protein [Planctomycetota bacterium]|nr:trypsin-like peptidase domain-containing protein [Planctomycetota bacterium]
MSLIALLLASLVLPGDAPPIDDEGLLMQEVFIEAVDRAAPSVVMIESFGAIGKVPDPIPQRRGVNPIRHQGLSPGTGPTTGVILTEDGEILTSSFAFPTDPAAIIVTLADGKRHTATLVARDFSRGIALLKIEATGLPAARFAAKGSVRVGQWALALGRSFAGDRPAPQMGIVSALDRISGRAIQTDAPTSPANYGGPLIDIEGAVLGIIVPLSPRGEEAAISTYDSGIGFAVPRWDIERVLDRLRGGDDLHPGFLGVEFDAPRTMGGLDVKRVLPGTSAEGAGIEENDKILRVGGRPVRTSFELQREIGRGIAGDVITLLIRRGDEEMEIQALLGKRPKKEPESD